MSSDQWVMILTFVSGVLILASQLLTLSDDWTKVLAFLVAVINLALSVFFGRAVYQGHQAAAAAKDKAA